jgi:ABC-type Fe3+ transport system permease subunit
VAGAVLSTVGMVSLVYGIVRSADAGWADPITLAAIGTGLLPGGAIGLGILVTVAAAATTTQDRGRRRTNPRHRHLLSRT